jgi:glycosyltransferase involved in cell wall biosynthesis
LRICLVYDCLYPYTVGGAERWYRNLGERLAGAGHEVTYLTLRQWDDDDAPVIPGVNVVVVGPRFQLYTESGRRRIWPPLRFGVGVFRYLLRHRRRFDVVHTAATPFFGLIAIGLLRRSGRYRLVVDWHEVWTRAYWQEYLGRVGGWVGWRIQRWCARIPHRAFCFSRLHARRLREEGYSAEPTVLEGEYAGPVDLAQRDPTDPVVVYAGRHIPEKRVPELVRAFRVVRDRTAELRCVIFGDGPDRPEVLRLIDELDLSQAVEAPGFVDGDEVDQALRKATCLALPSRREGYGLVVVEASARGTPSVVVVDEDNAAVELVEDGVNGVIAPSAGPDDLAAAILRVHDAGAEMRASTAEWFARNERRLSLESSLETVVETYGRG